MQAGSHDDAPVTRLLREAAGGSASAMEALLPLVYEDLKRRAADRLKGERAGHTLSATALVNEAYVKLVDQDRVEWNSRAHFYAVASQAMRRILVDYARTRHRAKRGGPGEPISLDGLEEALGAGPMRGADWDELIDLDRSLERLREVNPRSAEIVHYRFFGGLAYEEIADVLGVSVPTVRRSWTFARMWLRRDLSRESPTGVG